MRLDSLCSGQPAPEAMFGVVPTGYNPALVTLSIAIAVFASYTALDLGGRAHGASSDRRWIWLAGASVAMGGGIWSMHFIGMLALQMAMPAAYGLDLTLASLVIAIGATGAAFAWVSRHGARLGDVLLSGPLLGLGVAAMHYTGMTAMQMPGSVAYDPWIVTVSVLIAVTAATAALWLTFRQNSVWQKLLAAAVMGIAVAGMHYTGMAAATFALGADAVAPDAGLHRMTLGQDNLALYVSGATFLILFLAMLASSLEQQRIQRRLFASEARFRAAAEAVGDIIWTNDASGQMRGRQPDWERFTGQNQDEYEGFGWSGAVHPDDVEASTAAWAEAVAERREFTAEHRVRRYDGQYRLFAIRAVPVFNQDRTVREWVGVHEDITERRDFEVALGAARDAAEEANQAKSTFIANMSHELRTPLSAIIGYSEMMLEELGGSEGAAGLATDIQKVESNARHLLGLINDVLDLSKVESGKMEVFPEQFDAASMIREVAATAQSLADRKNNRLELALDPNLGTIEQDLIKVRQILLNLLSNAAKFTQEGLITVSARREPSGKAGDAIVIQVSDTGIGMSSQHLAKLFQRFQQADTSTTRRFGGTGLGLSLTKALAEMLGGTVSVASVEGQGTTFDVTLPAQFEAAPEAAPPDPLDRPFGLDEADPERPVVLVIDDDRNQLALMGRFLHREGFQVRTAGSGKAGLSVARELKPRVILLDVVMPDVDGWTVLRALKADPELADTPIVMVTFVDQRGLALSLGAADYVLKPVRWEQVKAVMASYRTHDAAQDRSDEAAERTRPAPTRDWRTAAAI